MYLFFVIIFQKISAQIYSLDENLICNDILCDQGDYTSNLYYGQQHFGDMSGLDFGFQFFIRIDANIASSQGQGFIASIMDGSQILLELKQKNMNTFTVSYQATNSDLVALSSTTWYQVYISQSVLYVGDWVNREAFSHPIYSILVPLSLQFIHLITNQILDRLWMLYINVQRYNSQWAIEWSFQGLPIYCI